MTAQRAVSTICPMKKRLKRPANTNQFVKSAWGDGLACWINKAGMTSRFHSVFDAAVALGKAPANRQAQSKLNQMLADFSFTPAVLLSGTKGCLVVWRDSLTERRNSLREALEIVGSGDSEACRKLLRLLEAGRLWALKQCTCSKWFFAIKGDQVSCSAACRKLKHEKTEAYRVRRRSRRLNQYAQSKDQEKRWLKRT